ncbi:hypothetical protein Avbf_15897 [Armadillidium vulgare]|nr:hypothetical protein Avbf_15897 [Armadillidium vulgare]
MAELDCYLRSHIRQSVIVSISLWLLFSIFPSEAKFFLGELPFQDRLDLGFSPSGPSAEFPIPDQVRLKRSAEKLLDDGIDASQNKEKKAPRKFLGLRGKKAPSSFLGMRGRREDSATDFSEREFPYGDVYYEDLASPLDDNELGQSLGTLKRAPSAFLGMRGKKAPSVQDDVISPDDIISSSDVTDDVTSVKRVPSAFLGMRG